MQHGNYSHTDYQYLYNDGELPTNLITFNDVSSEGDKFLIHSKKVLIKVAKYKLKQKFTNEKAISPFVLLSLPSFKIIPIKNTLLKQAKVW